MTGTILGIQYLEFIAIIVGAYLIGSIPFGMVIARVLGLGDLRKIGSGNIGATNVIRTGNKFAGLITVLLDMGKGTVVVVTVDLLVNSNASQLAALAVFFGHLYPVWLKFRGGKGVATYFGVLIALSPIIFFVASSAWLVAFLVSKISSVGAITIAFLVPIFMLLFEGSEMLSLTVVISLGVLLRHQQNIHRLIAGKEPRVSFKNTKNDKPR